MYTLHRDHQTWQQNCSHEGRDRLRYRMRNEKMYYDPHENEQYLDKMETIKMKRFFGKHLTQYMPNNEPMAEAGIYKTARFAPLAVTGFSNKEGWNKNSRRTESSGGLSRGGKFIVSHDTVYNKTKIRNASVD